ncbi:alpha/beta fold hydrolase [Anaerobium acetethylicum]|uniref:Alpha/beta hydrolase family protein n=1 Tax=Anaerobium acetethylicum TaxID=1619234 RepID=A0A1D3TSZ1_9FIRM|nr:alpha/beta fold hydrolase [Anaerobium acetethylicum]SCP96957.1 Alpha/beta hydrolase family protein [Anaerobium acetethylicum]
MKKHLRIALIAITALIILLGGAFLIYASDYYRADDTAIAVMQSDSDLHIQDNLVVLSSPVSSDTALIFYPGAKVEYLAYLPLLEKIRESCGITCILVEMPFNMAIFDKNAADEIINQFPEIRNWYIGGHSMGGAMASDYASKHQEKVKGQILLGAYIYGDYPEENALTVYGTFNTSVEEKINYTENIVVIEGGNHAQFGNYGKQKGDPDATISSEEQQNITVEAIGKFLADRKQ